jgi:hypothetical protein
MAQFIAFDDSIEVNGQTILSVVRGMGVFEKLALKILKEHGIDNPQPGRWYSQQAWLDAFKEIATKIGPNTLFEIGKKIPESADWPPEIRTIEEALASIDVAYHLNHRKDGEVLFNPTTGEMREGIGHYKFEKTGEREGIMVCENPYPCDFDRGIIYAVARKFKPEGGPFHVIVSHDETKPCRNKGGDSCTYIIKW